MAAKNPLDLLLVIFCNTGLKREEVPLLRPVLRKMADEGNPMEQIEKFTTNLNILCRSHLFKSRSLRVIQRLLHALNVFSSCPKPLYKMCNVASLIYQYYFKDNSLRKKTHKKQIQIIFGDCTTSFSIKISDKNSQFS